MKIRQVIRSTAVEPSEVQRAMREGRVKFLNARFEKSKPAPPEIRELQSLFKIAVLEIAGRLEELDRKEINRGDMLRKLSILKEKLNVLQARIERVKEESSKE